MKLSNPHWDRQVSVSVNGLIRSSRVTYPSPDTAAFPLLVPCQIPQSLILYHAFPFLYCRCLGKCLYYVAGQHRYAVGQRQQGHQQVGRIGATSTNRCNESALEGATWRTKEQCRLQHHATKEGHQKLHHISLFAESPQLLLTTLLSIAPPQLEFAFPPQPLPPSIKCFLPRSDGSNGAYHWLSVAKLE